MGKSLDELHEEKRAIAFTTSDTCQKYLNIVKLSE